MDLWPGTVIHVSICESDRNQGREIHKSDLRYKCNLWKDEDMRSYNKLEKGLWTWLKWNE